MNGYFQLINEGSGSSIKLIPPTLGGTPVDTSEAADYLTSKGIAFEYAQIHKAALTLRDVPVTVKLGVQRAFPQQEMFMLNTSVDKMTATARFYAPSTDGAVMDKAEILTDLHHKKIMYGIDEQAIDTFLKMRNYCEDIVLARGSMPVQGTDASIEYYFNTDLKARPTLNEDGTVDFFHLNTLNHCNEGDVLARLFPEDAGTPGTSVYGDKALPREVKKLRLEFGRNIQMNEERTVLTSLVNGHVMLVDNRVFVSDLLEVENVDNSTGDIEYEGSVRINGNVCSNFAVKAKGNVEIYGVVEGAQVEAGGNIIIARGVNGMSKGKLTAKGNIIAKFIENAEVSAGGYVESGSILHSVVMAKTEVNVSGRKGFITGGRVCATNKVSVKTLGSAMGADTIVDIGMNPEKKRRYSELQKLLLEADKTLKTIQPVIVAITQKLSKGIKISPEQLEYVKSLNMVNLQKQDEVREWTEELNGLQEVMEQGHSGEVIVTGEVFPGTRIIISEVSMVVKTNMKYCRFVRERGDVKMTAL